jgi:hypothetical protein
MYYSNLALFDQNGKLESGEEIPLAELKGKDEAWLRDTLFENPEIIPIAEIDPTFGPLVPVCKELRTGAGSIDAVFVNDGGRLTILECKLWKNPQARRQVVAQTLDYVGALSRWSYADLQAQVAAALRKQGNNPFESVRKQIGSRVRESEFIDSVSRSLREGRFLVLLAGDGIKEGVESLTELVNRNASKAVTFGLIEVATYKFTNNKFAIQPRVLAKTKDIVRWMTAVTTDGKSAPIFYDEVTDAADEEAGNSDKEHLRAWWQPVIDMKFDDPEQEPPKWLATNNIAISTPYPGLQIKGWSLVNRKQMGIYLTGPATRLEAIEKMVRRDKQFLLENLPKGTVIDPKSVWPIVLKNEDAMPDAARYAWLKTTLNEFANVLRPRLRKWFEETSQEGVRDRLA